MNKAITDGAQLMPPGFAQALAAFSGGDGTPGSQDCAHGGTLIRADADFGDCLEITKTQSVQALRYMGETPLLPGCYLRVSARVKAVCGALPSARIAGFAGGPRGAAVEGVQTTGPVVQLRHHGQVVEVSAIVGPGARNGVDMIWGRAALYGHFGLDLTGPKGGVVRIESIEIEDITPVFLRDMLAVVDVRDFGAQGDGETDDSAAFEAADAAARGRRLLVSAGRYALARDVTLEAGVQFEGQVIMPEGKTLILRRNFDLPSYSDAFGADALALQKGICALMRAEAPDLFDLKGREVVLAAPLRIAQPGDGCATRVRKTIANGRITARAGRDWAVSEMQAEVQWSARTPSVVTGTGAQALLGAQVTGAGVLPETYVCAEDAVAGTLTLSQPLEKAAEVRVLTFTRFRYLLDFSGLESLRDVTLSRLQLFCDGVASGVMLAPSGSGMRFHDCVWRAARDRALTSCGTGCAGLLIDGCEIADAGGVAVNLTADSVRIVNTRAVGAHPFAHIAGQHALVSGCQITRTVPGPGIVLIQSAASLITGCHFENATVRIVGDQTLVQPDGNLFSVNRQAGGTG